MANRLICGFSKQSNVEYIFTLCFFQVSWRVVWTVARETVGVPWSVIWGGGTCSWALSGQYSVGDTDTQLGQRRSHGLWYERAAHAPGHYQVNIQLGAGIISWGSGGPMVCDMRGRQILYTSLRIILKKTVQLGLRMRKTEQARSVHTSSKLSGLDTGTALAL